MSQSEKVVKSGFTDEQKCAIYTKGSDILVSAGAGSGKTKVLTQRIYVKLLQGIDISNLLVLTFTNAAAAEMKTRLKDRIKYALEKKLKKDSNDEYEDPTLEQDLKQIVGDDSDFSNPLDKVFPNPEVTNNLDYFKKVLEEQNRKIDSALVTTFDSFALGVIKKYHYDFGVDKNVKIANADVLSLKKACIMDEVFNELYQENNKAFENLLEVYTHKSDNEIKKTLIKLADKVKKYLRKGSEDELFTQYKEIYYNDNIIDDLTNAFVKTINKELQDLISDAATGADIYLQKKAEIDAKVFKRGKILDKEKESLTKYGKKITLMDGFAKYFNLTRSYDEIKDFFNANPPQDGHASYDKSVNNFLKEYKAILNKYLFYSSSSHITEAINGSLETTDTIVDILRRYIARYDQLKKDLGVYEFDDISKDVLRKFSEWDEELKADPTALNPLKELRDSFDEILLDEYQDTSDIQEDFMNYIKRDNLYMVGDMKQSIYRFRDANPYLFKDKYNNYDVHNGERRITKPTRINLTFNFRSRKEVLDNINLMFDNLMTDKFGDADYQNGHRMVYGRKKYDDAIVSGFDYNQEYLYYKNDENSEFDSLKFEAYVVAKKIQELKNPQMKIVDKEDEKFNNIKYSDFAVIIPRIDTARYYQEVFEELKIPYNLKVSEKIKDCKLFVVIISLINLIKNVDSYISIKNNEVKSKADKEKLENFNYYFMSVARSFLFGEKDANLLKYMLNGVDESDVFKKAQHINEYSKTHSITSTFEEMVKEFHFYEAFVRIGDVEKYLYVLDYLQKTVADLASLGYDFKDIAEHFEEVKEKEVETKLDNNMDKDAVTIVNIHKSKGLEYPICFFTDLAAKFNTSDIKGNFIYSKNHGFIAPYFENGRFETLMKMAFKEQYSKEDTSEHVRLFYVALTRAREKMYFVVPEPKKNNNQDDQDADELRFNSYTAFIETYFEQAVKDYKKIVTEEEIKEFIEQYSDKSVDDVSNGENNSTEQNIGETIIENSLENQDAIAEKIPNPYSLEYKPVNIETTILNSSGMSMEINELISSKVAENLEIGTRLHESLQSLDLVAAVKDDSVVDSLELAVSDKELIKKVLKLSCFAKIEQAKLYKEYEFLYNEESIEDDKKYINTRHGIIDLLVEYDDRYEIIDYKTNEIEKEEYEKQLNGYRKYLETLIKASGINKDIKMYLVSLVKGIVKEVAVKGE